MCFLTVCQRDVLAQRRVENICEQPRKLALVSQMHELCDTKVKVMILEELVDADI